METLPFDQVGIATVLLAGLSLLLALWPRARKWWGGVNDDLQFLIFAAIALLVNLGVFVVECLGTDVAPGIACPAEGLGSWLWTALNWLAASVLSWGGSQATFLLTRNFVKDKRQ